MDGITTLLIISGLTALGLVFTLYKIFQLNKLLAEQLIDTKQFQSLSKAQFEKIEYLQQAQKEHQIKLLSEHASAGQKQLFALEKTLTQDFASFKEQVTKDFSAHKSQFEQQHTANLKTQQEGLMQGLTQLRSQLDNALKLNTDQLNKTIEKLISNTDERLRSISQEVEKRLSDGFEKTTKTFTDILKRLAIIDEAQKKITELSTNIVSLQDILSDKKSRGAFGEVQLNSLIRNVMPEQHFSLQHTLSNGKRPDCFLYLPKPTGDIAIDAKFPLENYHRAIDKDLSELELKAAKQRFTLDIKKHIDDIASKYILDSETADGAIMFLPAEAVFAEIHANYPELIQAAHKAKVWIVSPTTLMAILTTARSVLKDEATKKQIHIIQEHLGLLATDFSRFQKRMDNLSRHINQAQQDVEQVHMSAKKISQRFTKIEKVELESTPKEKESLELID